MSSTSAITTAKSSSPDSAASSATKRAALGKCFGAHHPNGSARFHIPPHRLGQPRPTGSFLSLEHHPVSVAAALPHLLAAAQPGAVSTCQARDVSMRRVAGLRRVRAGLCGKINVENDIGPATTQHPVAITKYEDGNSALAWHSRCKLEPYSGHL
jgi:hypothetical protein